LKRSNRLVLLVGVFLAIVAFVGILLLANGNSNGTGGGPRASAPPTTGSVVVAAKDIPLSTRITADELSTVTKDLTAILPGAFTDPSQVVGQIARQAVASGAQVTSATTSGGVPGEITNLECPATFRCMAVQVNQVNGVGTVIKTGDYVDMVVGLTDFPVTTINPTDNSITVVSGLNSTSVKLLLQGLQVMGTLLPPVEAPAATAAPAASPAPSSGTGGQSTALNGQQEIVILAVSAQQSEVLKFAQMDPNPDAVTLALRSPADFIDPITGAPLPPVSAETTGIILKTLVDSYGVLPPEIVQTVTPTATRRP
jgi:Flp pilus assembly protein CpaB